MSNRKVYLEWSIDENELLYNIPIGFEVELSENKHFNQITTTLNTFDESDPYGSYRFFYSLDNGTSWIQFPFGDEGMSFMAPFLMRVEIIPEDTNYFLSVFNGTLKKISADSKAIIDTATLNFETIIDTDQYQDILYLVGNKTLYKIDGKTLEPSKNSLPLLTNEALGIIVDGSRNTLWQINNNSVWCRDLQGSIKWSVDIPIPDIDYSSRSIGDFYYNVANAGTTATSGDYIWNGIDHINGKKVYFNGSYSMTWNGLGWQIADISCVYYHNTSVNPDTLLSTWTNVLNVGALPPPTVTKKNS